MYTIYKGKKPDGTWKIGCDSKYPNRPLEQNLTEYFILEQHECGWNAGDRELELQKEHGLPVDNVHYMISVKNSGWKNIHTKEHQKKAFAAMLAKNPNHQSKAGKKGGITHRIMTMDDARDIRLLFSKGDTYNQLAKKYDVGYHTIYRIIKNDRYKEE